MVEKDRAFNFSECSIHYRRESRRLKGGSILLPVHQHYMRGVPHYTNCYKCKAILWYFRLGWGIIGVVCFSHCVPTDKATNYVLMMLLRNLIKRSTRFALARKFSLPEINCVGESAPRNPT